MKNSLFILVFFSFVFMQYNFNLIDQNSNSDSFGQEISPSSYPGKVTLYYFGHQN